MLLKQPVDITVAIDGTGGDRGSRAIVGAVRFALTLYPGLKLIIFGPSSLQEDLIKEKVDDKRYEFVNAPQGIPQDEDPRRVLKFRLRSAMALAIEAVKEGKAQAVVSGGGTGPLVTLSRHILGSLPGLRPALCARMPAGANKFSLMLDLGANARAQAQDLYGFAKLGSAACECLIGVENPRVAVLNVGTEQGKGPALIREARDLIGSNRNLNSEGFIEANHIFKGDVDVIVTDGFTGNIALKAAEGVAGIYSQVTGIKKFFSKLSHPEWLLPWQYNGSVLLGVNGIVIKSHASAGEEAMAIAMVEAAKAVEANLFESMKTSIYLKD